jgi:hypothetical protein
MGQAEVPAVEAVTKVSAFAQSHRGTRFKSGNDFKACNFTRPSAPPYWRYSFRRCAQILLRAAAIFF